jgi:phosphoribosylaminoimidazole-succinocarboxamide synthase
VDGQPWDKKAPAPALPEQVIRETGARYAEALRILTR